MLLSMKVMCHICDNLSYSFQHQHIQHIFEYFVEKFFYFTVLGCTEHSGTTVGNVTRHLTVHAAEFNGNFSRTVIKQWWSNHGDPNWRFQSYF